MLGDVYVTASNIKSRVNLLICPLCHRFCSTKVEALQQAPYKQICSLYWNIVNDDDKEKKIMFNFEPFRPINDSLYLCDNQFHTEALNKRLESDEKFGFIVMNGNGTLFGTLSWNNREVLDKFTVDFPKKHGRARRTICALIC